MFSAIRRHFQSSQPSQATSPRPTPLPQSLQEKFQRGITANMRILICGKKKSGKTSLLNRLKGKPHSIEYNPTKEVVKACFYQSNSGPLYLSVDPESQAAEKINFIKTKKGGDGKLEL